ncbi:SseB family protein [Streptomyces sp. 4N509B]|uniref:SseB family protein n=1 Tax=Streptomyces sp. 4N509B TaxID=3457413 RepID=UPI003FD43071
MALKNIPQPAFADDDGTADPEVARALAEYARDPSAAEPRLLGALARARLLVPVVAVLGESETDQTTGLRREKSSEMAVLTLTVPSGRRALPVFTAIETLSRWRADARPVPVTAAQALRAALQERADTVVVDLAGPVTYEITGPALRALADGGTPPAARPAVAAAVREVLGAEPAVVAAHLVPGGQTDGTLALLLDAPSTAVRDAGGPDDGMRAVVTRLARALAAHETLRSHLVRGLDLAVLPPEGRLPDEPTYRR